MPEQSNELVSLSSAELHVEVDPAGAQLFSVRDSLGRDLLWNGNESVWAGRAPLLFPIVGSLVGGRYRLGTKTYPLPRHGFARHAKFAVRESAAASATFHLASDPETLAVYPFHFDLRVRFEVRNADLSITASIANLGDEPMPASFGYHPGFRWPLPYGRAREAHFINFANDEPGALRRLDGSGLLTPQRHPSPIVHRRLALCDELFQHDALIFDELRSQVVTYGADDGPHIRVHTRGAPYLGVWSKPSAHFVCIEPWHGIADPVEFTGEFMTKPGVFMIACGETVDIPMQISLVDG